MFPSTVNRVPAHTDDGINERIRHLTEQNILHFRNAGLAAITQRLPEHLDTSQGALAAEK